MICFRQSWWGAAILALALCAAATPRPAGAGVKPQDKAAIDRCYQSDEARRTYWAALYDCYHMEMAIQDRALNKSYQSALRSLTAPQRTTLRNSQRRWLKTREQSCARESDAEGGWEHTDGKMAWFGCHIHTTYQRIDWLDRYASRSAK